MLENNASASEIAQRAAIVAAACSWIGTPYHNCADVKGAGVDCGMLLVRVFVDTGLCEPFDPRPYPPDWHLHRSEEKYLGFVFDRAREVEQPRPGDVAVFKFGRCYSHAGIVAEADPLAIVHAYAPARRVIQERVHQNAVLAEIKRAPRFFSLWQSRAQLGLAGGSSGITRSPTEANGWADFAAQAASPLVRRATA
jgi:cell wall-associated NlpC family hydrolase